MANFPTPVEGDEFGGYELLRPLGKGGAAVVWEVVDEGGAHFALKLLHPAIAADPSSRQRLAREASTLNRIRNKGVASVVDLETDGSHPFVVTELIRGLTLRDELRESGPMGFEEALTIARSLKSTLEAVHAAGVIHRDLKPSNIILGEQCPVLIDFGIAQSDDDDRLTATGLVSGTPGWVAPEVLRGDSPNEGSDWWAWSAVLLNMLTARPPYGGGGFEAVAARQHLNRPDSEGVYPPLAQVLKRALGPKPGRPTATEVLSELEALDPAEVDNWDPQSQEATTLLAEQTGVSAAQAALMGEQTSVLSQGTDATAMMPTSSEVDAATPEVDATSMMPTYPEVDATAPLAEDDGPVAPDGTALIYEDAEPAVGQTSVMPVDRKTVWPQQEAPAWPQQEIVDQGFEPSLTDGYVREGGELMHRDQEVASLPPDTYPTGLTWNFGYMYKPVQGSFLLGIGLASVLALLPVLMQFLGWLIAAGALLIAQTVGLARTWRERRRVSAGRKRPGDNWLAVLVGVPFVIRSALSLAFNLAVAGLILIAAWALYSLNAGGHASHNPYISMLNGMNPIDAGTSVALVALLWASNLFMIFMSRIGIGGWHLREGANAITSTILPSKLARNLLGLAALGITIAGIFHLGV
ncbi:MAG: serine/threonine-protein kinase [Actinomycetaceae bacterium]|nr:serine/threonine-protein kinase [Actinomycetaceae bacterium]